MQGIDRSLFFCFLGLTLFGLIMMSSMSVAGSFDVTGRNDYYFWRHFIYIILGIPIFFISLKFPHEYLKKLALPIFLFALLLLVLVLIIGQSFGTAAKSWLSVGGVISVQPTEIAKIATIIFLSAIFSSPYWRADTFERGFVTFVVIAGLPVLLVMAQPDFGSILVLATAASSIYFVAGAKLKHFIGGMGVAFLGFLIVVLTTPYIQKRVAVLLNPDLDPLGAGFQVKQALIAIGSGGIFGRGFQNSIQKFDYLPEVQSDTIFAAISEEMGFFRIIALIGIYVFIAYRGFQVAKNAPTTFSQLLATGLTVWIVGQAFINIGVNLAILPNTGITLPLISYGGTSLWTAFVGFGILLHISSECQQKGRKKHFY
ncbi:MAG TPA: putative peptidoglycan glycosyltransferase FtsW [Candidatus Gracilibacteria bacterium]